MHGGQTPLSALHESDFCLVGKLKKVAWGELKQLPRCDEAVLRARKLLC